jgi:hypothetical protein
VTERLTCDDVRDRELIERYAAGTLGEPEAEALEAHAFGCEACWAEMQCAVELHAALTNEGRPGIRLDQSDRARLWRWPIGLAAAAVLVLAIGVTWYAKHRPGGNETVLRGPAGDLAIAAEWQPDGSLHVWWSPVPTAFRYRVEIAGAPGDVGDSLVQHSNGPEAIVAAQNISRLHTAAITVEAEGATGEVISRGTLLSVRDQ